MPLYEYRCDTCGDFDALRRMSLSSQPCECPACGEPASRVHLSAPGLATMAGHVRAAHATNERAQHAPMSSGSYLANRRHGPGCGCCNSASRGATRTTQEGAKLFPSKRPWMISH